MNMNRKNAFVKLLSIMLTVVMIMSVMPLNVIVGTATGTEQQTPSDGGSGSEPGGGSETTTPSDGGQDPVVETVTHTITVTDEANNDLTSKVLVTVGGAELTAESGVFSYTFAEGATEKVTAVIKEKVAEGDAPQYASQNVELDPAAAETAHEVKLAVAEYTVRVIDANKTEDNLYPYGTQLTFQSDDHQPIDTAHSLAGLEVTVNGKKTSYTAAQAKSVDVVVEGDVTVAYIYNKSITVSVPDVTHGVVRVDDKIVTGSVLVQDDPSVFVSYEAIPDPGYRAVVKIDHVAAGTSGFLRSANSLLEVTFEEVTYTLSFNVTNNTEEGSVIVNDVALNKDNLTLPSVTVHPDAEGKYSAKVDYSALKEHYSVTIDGSVFTAVSDDKTIYLTGNANKSVNIVLNKIEYTLTFIDPFISVVPPETEAQAYVVKKTVEDDAFCPQIGTEIPSGLTFAGWTKDAKDSHTVDMTDGAPAVITSFKKGDVTANGVFYAVYDYTEKAEVTLTSKPAYNNDKEITKYYNKAGAGEDEILNATTWFSNDVTLTLKQVDGFTPTVKVQDQELAASAGKYVVKAPAVSDEETVKTESVTISYANTAPFKFHDGQADEVAFTYKSKEADSLNVNFDVKAPSLDVSEAESAHDTITDTIKYSDQKDGSNSPKLYAIELDLSAAENADLAAYFNEGKTLADQYSNQETKEFIQKIKDELAAKTGWQEITSASYDETKNEYSAENTYNVDAQIVTVYRVLDAAGNVAYSAFDLTKPSISDVKIKYQQNGTDKNAASGDIYVQDGVLTVSAVVEDNRTAYIRNKDFVYDGVTLVVSDGTTSKNYPFTAKEAWYSSVLKYDKYLCEFTIQEGGLEGLNNKALTFTVKAEDQAGNQATDVSYDGDVVLVAGDPAISFAYNPAAASDGKVYAKDKVTVTITVDSPYFNIAGLASSVVVKGSSGTTYTTTPVFSTTDQWVGTVDVLANDKLTVTATGSVGNTATADSAEIVIDTAEPVIAVEYQYKLRNGEEAVSENGEAPLKDTASDGTAAFSYNRAAGLTAKITVTDDNLSQNDADYTVTVDGTPLTGLSWSFVSGKAVLNVELASGETADQPHTIDVTAKDLAGNPKTFTNGAATGDGTAPEITGVSLALDDTNFFKNVIHTISGGIFYKKNATVTVTAKDAGSGVYSAVLYLTVPEGTAVVTSTDDDTLADNNETVVVYEVAATGTPDGDGNVSITFNLPYVADAESQLGYWQDKISVLACDIAGNTSEKTAYDGKTITLSDTDKVLYEAIEPDITSAMDKKWIKTGDTLTAEINDQKEAGTISSGLYSVRVKVNDGAYQTVYDINTAEAAATSYTVSLTYDDFTKSGKNSVSIKAVDVAGNSKNVTYTVFKDDAAPTLKSVNFSGEADKNILSHGNYYNTDTMTATVAYEDAAPTSGIAEVKAEYVVSETEVYPLTTESAVATVADPDDAAAASVVFTLTKTAEMEGKSGLIRITLKDNSGNETVYTGAEADVKPTVNYTVNSVTFDAADPDLIGSEITASDEYTTGDKYFTQALENVTVKVKANDAVAGIRSVKVMLGETELKADAFTDKTASADLEYKLSDLLEDDFSASDTSYTVTLVVTDNAGNDNHVSKTYIIDNVKPGVVSVAMVLPENATFWQKVIHKLQDVFFGENVTVEVVVDDPATPTDASGVAGVKLVTKGYEKSTGNVNDSVEIPEKTRTGNTFTFELPVSESQYWNKLLHFTVTDNVGNEYPFDAESEDFSEIQNTVVLYENEAASIDEAAGNASSVVTATDAEGNSAMWLKNGQTFDVDVDDGENGSGLYSVTVTVNGTESASHSFAIDSSSASNVLDRTFSFNAEDFDAGENTITLTVEDISGNTSTKTYTVYKDVANPTASVVSLSLSEDSQLAHGNYGNDGFTATVNLSDALPSSGFRSVEAFFVTDGGEKIALETTADVDANCVTDGSGSKTQVLTFTAAAEKVLGKSGHLEVTVKDNAGRESTLVEDRTITIENEKPDVVAAPAEGIALPSGGTAYRLDQELTFTVDAEDKGEQVSGLRSVVVTLNGEPVINWAADAAVKTAAAPTQSFNVTGVEKDGAKIAHDGENTIVITVVDNAGNEKVETQTVYIDDTVPAITSVALDVNKGQRLPYGNFFNAEAVLTVVANDKKDAYDGGVASATLTYTENGTAKTKTEAAVYNEGIGAYVITFTLPVNDSESALSQWKASLKLSVTDTVGKTTEPVAINALPQAEEGRVTSDNALYEVVPPVVTSSASEEDAAVFYLAGEAESRSLWLKKDNNNFTVTVTDNASGEGNPYDSGINRVTITIADKDGAEVFSNTANVVTENEQAVYTWNTTVPYAEFAEGKNTVTVKAFDNAGNDRTETWTVYKDSTAPVVSSINIDPVDGSNLAHGNYYNSNVVVTLGLTDVDAASGIASVSAVYIYDEGNSTRSLKLNGGSSDKADALTAGDVTLTSQFTLAETNNTTGYLKITVTDNAGNTSEFNQTTAIPEGSNIKVNEITFENTVPGITETHESPNKPFVQDSKECYPDADVTYTIKVADPLSNTVLTSGLRNIDVTLNGEKVDAASIAPQGEDAEATVSFNLKDVKTAANEDVAKQGDNVIIVTAADNAGNPASEEYHIFIDSTAPVVTAVNLDVNDGQIRKYGNFFRTDATLTIAAKDNSGVLDTGVAKAILTYTDLSESGSTAKTVENDAVYDSTTETYVITFTLPVKDSDQGFDAWKNSLKVTLVDKVDIHSNAIAINELIKNGVIKSDVALYETALPVVTSSADADGVDTAVLYAAGDSTLWLKKGASFNVNVADGAADGDHLFDSGLYQIQVKVTDREGNETFSDSATLGENDNAVYTWSKAIANENFKDGANTVTVTAVDNAGNPVEYTKVVYKDVFIPVVDRVDLDAGKGSNLSYGNFCNGDATVTLAMSDKAFSSGIASVVAEYVVDEEHVYALTEKDGASPETDALVSGDTALTRTFELKAVPGTSGYLKITVTDNVGNEVVFGQASTIPTGSNISSKTIVFEDTAADVVITPTDVVYVSDAEEDCFPSADAVDITVTVNDSVDADGNEAAKTSGIRSVTTKLNDKIVSDATEDLSEKLTADKTYTLNAGALTDAAGKPLAKEGANVLTVTVVDNAGTVTTETYEFVIDSEVPQIAALRMAVSGNLGFLKMLNFGNFFNGKIVISVYASDRFGVYDSYLKKAVLTYVDHNDGDALKTLDNTQSIYHEKTDTYRFTFTLPLKAVDETDLEYWKSTLSVSVVDNVGNSSEVKPISDVSSSQKPLSSDILFEKQAPNITSSLNDQDEGGYDDAVVYTGAEKDSYWVRDGISFAVDVNDSNTPEYDSGLSSVTVTVNGEVIEEYGFKCDPKVGCTFEHHVDVAYDLLKAGENEIKVHAVDLSGNTADDSFTVYKDETAPAVSRITVKAGEGSLTEYGNFFNSDVTVTLALTDAQFSSGVSSVTAKYIADDGKTYDLTEADAQKPESEPLVKGASKLTRTFNLAYVDNTTGYLEITVTDNVGNKTVFTKDSAIPKGSNIKVTDLMFEQAQLTFTLVPPTADCVREATATDGEEAVLKQCFKTTDIDYSFTVSDDAVKQSGIRSVKTTLNGVEVEDCTADLKGGFTDQHEFSFNVAAFDKAHDTVTKEGENVIEVVMTDNAGNVDTKTVVFFLDATDPVITSVTLETKEGNAFLNRLTFGNFFNDKVILKVVATDKDSICDSGVASATLVYKDYSGEKVVTRKLESTDVTVDGDSHTFEFELPLGADKDAETAMTYWKSVLSVYVTDGVGNDTDPVAVHAFADGIDNLDSDSVLYETIKPNIHTSLDNQAEGAADGEVLYFEEDQQSFWVRKDAKFEIDVDDNNVVGYNSGLQTVTVTNNGQPIAKYGYQLKADAAESISEHHVDFDYNLLKVGKNEIKVYVKDISGNEIEKLFIVYKDAVKPAVAGITVDAGEGSLKDYGNFFNDGFTVTLALKDSEFSSGISSVAAKYVADDGKVYPLTETDAKSPESSPLVSGDTLIERTFTLDFVEDTTGYLEFTVTDNVGNVTVFTKDSKIPENSNITVNDVMFEKAQLKLDVDSTKPDCIRDETVTAEDGSTYDVKKNCYMTDNVKFDVKVTDDAKKQSGIRTLTTTLNDVVVEAASADLSGKKLLSSSYTFNIGDLKDADDNKIAVEGENVVKIVLTDNAGNTFTQVHYVYLDYTLPVITAVKMNEVEANATLNLLTFGNFFNGKVILTVVATDKDSICNTGVPSATLTYTDFSGKKQEDRSIENKDVTVEGENHIFTFELPIEKGEDAKEALAHWKSVLSVSIRDGAGNETDPVAIRDLGKEIESSDVLFETEKPNIHSSVDDKDGKHDDSVLYLDKDGTESFWVRAGQSFVITVDDKNVDGYNAGLYSVEILDNDVVYAQKKYASSVDNDTFYLNYASEDKDALIVDYSSRMLGIFNGLPHVGGVVFENEPGKLEKLFHLLSELLAQRKEQMVGGTFAEYKKQRSGDLPAVVFVIDNYGSFKDKTEGKYENLIMQLSREGIAYGIYLFISGGGFGMADISARIGENMKTVITLELADKYKYVDALHTTNITILPEAGIRGRGLVRSGDRCLEFQTALINDGGDDYTRGKNAEQLFARMRADWRGPSAEPIPEIPANPIFSDFIASPSAVKKLRTGRILPIGYAAASAEVAGVDLSRSYCTLVTEQTAGSGRQTMTALVRSALEMERSQVVIVTKDDAYDRLADDRHTPLFVRSEDELFDYFKSLTPEFVRRNKQKYAFMEDGADGDELFEKMKSTFSPVFIMIDDLAAFFASVYQKEGAERKMNGFLENILAKGALHHIYFFGRLCTADASRISAHPAFKSFVSAKKGILTDGAPAMQKLLDFGNLGYAEAGKPLRGGNVCMTVEKDGQPTFEQLVIPNTKR